jgi:hypothetical protein
MIVNIQSRDRNAPIGGLVDSHAGLSGACLKLFDLKTSLFIQVI